MSGADDVAAKIRRSYGKGFADAARALGQTDIGEVMNLAKIRQLEQSLNGQARKVYEAIPIEAPIKFGDLMAKLTKSMGRPQTNVVEACAHKLVDLGLAKSTDDGRFQRVAARVVVPLNEATPMPDIKAVPTRDFPRSENPFAQLRARINDATNALAEIERLCSQIEVDNEKMQKLREALDSLR